MQSSAQTTPHIGSAPGDWSPKHLAVLVVLALFAFAVMGYHPGLEDDAFYLAAIKRDLNPALYPHDSEFFRLQFQATTFDRLIAFSVKLSHLPLQWALLLWQFAAIFLLLHGCWRIARRCFRKPEAQWAAVTMIAVLLTLPVTGTALNMADQHLHPRTLATAAILAAIVAVIDLRFFLGGILMAIAVAIHALMASFAISFCAFLLLMLRTSERQRQSAIPMAGCLLIPFGWMFEPASDAWRQAAATRQFYFLAQWHWYEWLGLFAPLVLLYILRQFLQARSEWSHGVALIPLVSAVLYYGAFQTVVGLALMLPPSLERVRPFEPMRYLHLVYVMFFLLAGGFLGHYLLDRRVVRWLLLFIPLGAAMFYAQRQLYPASAHVEWPGMAPKNAWLQAFAWIRQNTAIDSLFALDPRYTTLPGEDYHAFRALAERGAIADYDKDGGMAARVPRLAPRWLKEVTALSGWRNFQRDDFLRLKNEFGVNWVVLTRDDAIVSNAAGAGGLAADPQLVGIGLPNENHAKGNASSDGMTCPYRNPQLLVCRLY